MLRVATHPWTIPANVKNCAPVSLPVKKPTRPQMVKAQAKVTDLPPQNM
jgi:hypothetical protein